MLLYEIVERIGIPLAIERLLEIDFGLMIVLSLATFLILIGHARDNRREVNYEES